MQGPLDPMAIHKNLKNAYPRPINSGAPPSCVSFVLRRYRR